jgi:hypothetical protein
MKLSIPIIILFLLAWTAAAQLSSDRDRFDIEVHPGEVVEKVLTLTNIGDTPISEISVTSLGGDAKDFVFLDIPESEILSPKDKKEINIFFAIPPETKPGTYAGFMYLIDSSPPSMPLVVEFHINVVKQESYSISLSINDAKAALEFAQADEPAEMDLVVKNLGQFRDVASINSSFVPEGWSVSLLEGDDEVFLPYDVQLGPGASHEMKLKISSVNPGQQGQVNMTATSLGNASQNSSVQAWIKFGLAIRKYKAIVDVPAKMVVNRSYSGSFSIELDVSETIKLGVLTPPPLMVIPLTQAFLVSPEKAGVANFTLLASRPGVYPILFKAVDSNGMPLPDEIATITVIEPSGQAVLTGDSFLYKTIASLYRQDNQSVPIILVPSSGLSEKDKESLLSYSKVVILGNESVVSLDVEKLLADIPDVKRLEGENIGETTMRFISEMWKNGTAGVVISGPKDVDIFRAYQEARTLNFPLVIIDSSLTSTARSMIHDLTKRNIRLSRALIVGKVADDTVKALKEMGISVEEVAQ